MVMHRTARVGPRRLRDLRSTHAALRASSVNVSGRALQPRERLDGSHSSQWLAHVKPPCDPEEGDHDEQRLRRRKQRKRPPKAIGSWFGAFSSNSDPKNAVELRGFEPLTFCMPCR